MEELHQPTAASAEAEALRQYVAWCAAAALRVSSSGWWVAEDHRAVARAVHTRGLALCTIRSFGGGPALRRFLANPSIVELVLKLALPSCSPTSVEMATVIALCRGGSDGAVRLREWIEALMCGPWRIRTPVRAYFVFNPMRSTSLLN